MQTIILNEQESEPMRPAMTVGNHVGNLFLGLLFGLLLMLFDRRHATEWQPDQPQERHGSWQRPLLIFIGVVLFLFLMVMLLIGP